MRPKAILLMGPTATGKTELAVRLCKRFPCDIISVDSALVYRHMNIGTAKPDAATLRRAPHQLIDIRDPEDRYSAGEFVKDAKAAIATSHARQRVPLLVGGTMMYFRALTDGLADLPPADATIREQIDAEARAKGWPALHEELARVDPRVASRLNPNDSQRIQRALEVYRVSGRPLGAWQRDTGKSGAGYEFIRLALHIEPRSLLHARIEKRLDQMLENGFEDEVRALQRRPGLKQDSPSMRAVGYRQFWSYLAGDLTLERARDKALFATRQLAKRQLTWLRSDNAAFVIDPLEADAIGTISAHLAQQLG